MLFASRGSSSTTRLLGAVHCKVTKAVALSDLSKKEVNARGEILNLKNMVNGMVVRYCDNFSMHHRG
jgi:hypothetical protein